MIKSFWEQVPNQTPKVKHDFSWGSHGYKFHHFNIPVNPNVGERIFIGVDPGNEYGIAVIYDSIFVGLYGKLEHKSNKFNDDWIASKDETVRRGFLAMHAVKSIRDFLRGTYGVPFYGTPTKVLIEGSAHNVKFGVAALEQIRTGFAFGWDTYAMADVAYIAPKTARKECYGNGNMSAKDVWFLYNDEAADAMAIAIAAMKRHAEKPG